MRLLGASFTAGLLYEVDAATGAASNPRAIRAAVCEPPCVDPPVDATFVAGIDLDPAAPGSVWVATTLSNPDLPSALLVAPIDDPLAALGGIRSLGQQLGEGDIALTPSGDAVYAVGLTNTSIPFTLLRIASEGDAVVVGEIGSSDVSGLAFDASGTLYALDTGADVLRVLDPDDGSTLSSVALSEPLGAVAGMDFDFTTDTLYVADGGTGGRNALFTLDPATGVLAEIGPLGLASGLSGLAVPEPDAAALGSAAALVLAAQYRKRLRMN